MVDAHAAEKHSTLAIGAVRTRAQAERIFEQLKQADFADQDLSVISPDDKLAQDPKIAPDHQLGTDPADEKPRDGSEKLKGLTVGALSGGLVMGAIGGLIGLASLAIPGLGIFVIGGPIAAALADAAAGGAAGVIAGALMGMRIPESRAKQYERSLREGKTLISVHAPDADRLKRAMEILAAGDAEDLHEVVETFPAQRDQP
jgi:hypothetical protein